MSEMFRNVISSKSPIPTPSNTQGLGWGDWGIGRVLGYMGGGVAEYKNLKGGVGGIMPP